MFMLQIDSVAHGARAGCLIVLYTHLAACAAVGTTTNTTSSYAPHASSLVWRVNDTGHVCPCPAPHPATHTSAESDQVSRTVLYSFLTTMGILLVVFLASYTADYFVQPMPPPQSVVPPLLTQDTRLAPLMTIDPNKVAPQPPPLLPPTSSTHYAYAETAGGRLAHPHEVAFPSQPPSHVYTPPRTPLDVTSYSRTHAFPLSFPSPTTAMSPASIHSVMSCSMPTSAPLWRRIGLNAMTDVVEENSAIAHRVLLNECSDRDPDKEKYDRTKDVHASGVAETRNSCAGGRCDEEADRDTNPEEEGVAESAVSSGRVLNGRGNEQRPVAHRARSGRWGTSRTHRASPEVRSSAHRREGSVRDEDAAPVREGDEGDLTAPMPLWSHYE